MELSIPILYENKPVGTLTAARDGLYTVYTAACTVEGVTRLRLSVYGEDKEAYLGLMLPDGAGGLSLRKRLTRLEREKLPEPALFAAEEHTAFPELSAAQPNEPPAQSETIPAPGAGDVLWHAGPDGTLYAVDGAQGWIAIPEAHADIPPEARRLLREIDGSRYLVFPQ